MLNHVQNRCVKLQLEISVLNISRLHYSAENEGNGRKKADYRHDIYQLANESILFLM